MNSVCRKMMFDRMGIVSVEAAMKKPRNGRLRLCKPIDVELMSLLSLRERDVIRLFLGLDDGVERSLEDISLVFGVTAESVKVHLVKAMNKLSAGPNGTQPPTRPAQAAGLPREPFFEDCISPQRKPPNA
jgi:DNA-binding CsgD family transcriptional regulator